ncbi:hypothetical protein POM88_035465 [Heracleum sosnowskyi]|uniref:ABC transmembrane type-1 domain-containing protein n=1 Tax=Heracleum sosnowskyi TaxID=360622 RepID=A0AAD8HN76_9APIA|nr:hypothetical protein POM88_035465 [Heracleum sosnowskyi]
MENEVLYNEVGKFIQLTSTFIGGFAIAYIRGWLLALVLTSCILAVLIAGGFMARILSKMSSRSQVAYAEAGNIVEQTIGVIRTVASLPGRSDCMTELRQPIVSTLPRD